jgi:hypothetical protein
MTHPITRVRLFYDSQTQHTDPLDGYAVTDYSVSTNGEPPRPPRGSMDLQDCRQELTDLGFRLTQVEREGPAPHGRGWTRFAETWKINPILPDPDHFTTDEPNIDAGTYRIVQVRSNPDSYAHPYHWEIRSPAGELIGLSKKSEYEARWLLVQLRAPQLYQAALDLMGLATHHSDHKNKMVGRMLRACELLLDGDITPHPNGRYNIASHTVPGRNYHVQVSYDHPNWTCTITDDPDPDNIGQTCPDLGHRRTFRTANGPRCKHMMAAALLFHNGMGILPPDDDIAAPTDKGPSAAPESPSEAATSPKSDPQYTPSHNIGPLLPAPRHVAARYADGRVARYSDGTTVRYSAGGQAYEIPPYNL